MRVFHNTDIDRFWSKAEIKNEDECRNWTSGVRRGYGSFSIKSHPYYAHRMAYKLRNGEIPLGMLVCHKCDNPKCVNPGHLFLGTHSDNARDREKKGRSAPFMLTAKVGSANASAKLTETKVFAIRGDARSTYKIAADYGVSNVLISKIKRREIWAHI